VSVAGVIALVVAGGLSAGADVDAVPGPVHAAEASCPDPEAVRSALRRLATPDDPDRLVTATAEAGLAVEDLGDRMRVRVGGRVRTYADAARDCDRRARLAAVFAALVLTPRSAGDASAEAAGDEAGAVPPAPAPAMPAPPVAVAVVAAAAEPPRRRAETRFEAAPALALAPHRGATLVSPLLMLGAAWGSAEWKLVLAAGFAVAPARFSIAATEIGLLRHPLRLSAARTLDLGRLRAGVEAGVVVSVLRVERRGPAPTTAATRAEPGAHAGVELSLPAGRLAVYLALASDWIPRTYAMTLAPEGEVDRTPALWLSGEAGLRLSLH